MWLSSYILIGAITGWLSGQFMKGHGFGLLGDMIVGVVGASVGAYFFSSSVGPTGNLIVAFAGAIVLLYVVRLFTSRRPRRKVWSQASR